MEYLIYLLILISTVWFMSHFSAVMFINSIIKVIPYDWKTREEIIGILKVRKISNHCWILIIPISVQDILSLRNIYKNKESKLFIFVRYDINCILAQLEDVGIVQKKVIQTIRLSEVLTKSVELLIKIGDSLREDRGDLLSDILPSKDDTEALRKRADEYKNSKNDKVLNICQWKKVSRGKKNRKRIFFRLVSCRT